jgi:hypothetical protein
VSHAVHEQLRLLLEQRCSETGRKLASNLRGADPFLVMADLGEGGHLACDGGSGTDHVGRADQRYFGSQPS